jgi:UDP-N-acetylmuramoylalanine--D-glutamate ligase
LEGTCDFRPTVAVFLNFFADHLDRHTDLEAYWQAKTRIFANQSEEDTAIVNLDDPRLAELAGRLSSEVVTFSLRQHAEAERHNGQLWVAGQPVCAVDKIHLRGEHNLYNALAALAAVHAAGVDLRSAERLLHAFRGVANRLEEVAIVNGVTFINDSQATIPQAVEVALEAMDAPTLLIAGGRPKVSDFAGLAQRMQGKVKALFVIGEAAELIAAAARQAGLTAVETAASLPGAVQAAYSQAQPGDIVLMSPACASFDMFRNMSHRGEVFREAVRALGERGSG